MARIFGQIESLKRLENELKSSGINRFNSVKDINDFLFNFRDENELVIHNQREILKDEVKKLGFTIKENREKCELIKSKTIIEIEVKLDTIKINIETLIKRVDKSIFHKIFYSNRLKQQRKLLEYYSSNSSEIISNSIRNIQEIIKNDEKILEDFTKNNEIIIRERSLPEIEKLNYFKKRIEDLKPLIAGAYGENKVVNEIEKLPDDYILINDYNLRFYPPIFNRNNNDIISSIQIDHLLISKSGIYILETKNWSKKSVESLNLRSPVEQINRTSYALFVVVNGAKIGLTKHHWGDKQIPIKSIIVMITEKPKDDFKYVKVKTLKELNNYLTYFEPIFSGKEVDRIADYLLKMKN
jgi:hypothetical protein